MPAASVTGVLTDKGFVQMDDSSVCFIDVTADDGNVTRFRGADLIKKAEAFHKGDRITVLREKEPHSIQSKDASGAVVSKTVMRNRFTIEKASVPARSPSVSTDQRTEPSFGVSEPEPEIVASAPQRTVLGQLPAVPATPADQIIFRATPRQIVRIGTYVSLAAFSVGFLAGMAAVYFFRFAG